MRTLLLFLGVAVLFSGCVGKKRTTYGKRGKDAVVETRRDSHQADQINSAAAADEFVHIEISSIEEYITVFAPLAREEMRLYHIPASITLAQGILESGYGRGELTLKTNNHFGIKCHTGWEGQYDFYDDDAKGECFRKYNHPRQSYRDHSIFLSSRRRYADLFDLKPDDYKGWARGLKAAGYATDRKYPQKLISFIERYQLYRFDEDIVSRAQLKRKSNSESYKVYTVREGDTLYSISRKYLVSVSELMALNNLRNSKLAIGQQLKVKLN